MKNATANTTDNAITFDNVKENIITLYLKKHTLTATETATLDSAIITMSEIIALSVLKRLYSETGGQSFRELSIDIMRDSNDKERLQRLCNEKKITFDSDGNIKASYTKEQTQNIDKLVKERFGDGTILVNDSCVALMTELNYFIDNVGKSSNDKKRLVSFIDFDFVYGKEYVNKRVQRVDRETAEHFIIKEKTIFGHCFSTVRANIAETFDSVKYNPRDGHSYIEYETENESGDGERFYLRTAKFADLGGDAHEWNGHDFVIRSKMTATEYRADYERQKKIIESLNLTKRQTEILLECSKDRNISRVARKFKVSRQAVLKTLSQIQKKAIAIGLKPIEK